MLIQSERAAHSGFRFRSINEIRLLFYTNHHYQPRFSRRKSSLSPQIVASRLVGRTGQSCLDLCRGEWEAKPVIAGLVADIEGY